MKSIPSLLCGLVLLTTTSVAYAAAAPAAKPEAKTPAPATTPAPAPAAAPTPAVATLDEYITELVPVLTLSDTEKTEIHDLYAADNDALQKILNDASLSPLQKAQQVSDLRDVRNQKIESILHNLDRNHAFYQVEAVYRVALTEAVADSAPAPATPPPALIPGAAATPEAAPLNSNPATPEAPTAKTTAPPATNAPAANAPATNAPASNPPPM
jgi:hypothetical protein